MIIVPGGDITETKAAIAREDALTPPDDPPPSYTSSTFSHLPKASNFVAISKFNGHVKGSWTIDPSLLIPASFLPSLVEHETRKNFDVSTNNGVIDVDLTIVQSNNDISQGAKKRATIHLNSHNGMLTAKLHRAPCPQPLLRPSILITMNAHNGHINLCIPRSFQGPLSITTFHGSVRFSPGIETAATTFSDMRTRKCFVGDYSTWREGETWMGDVAVVEAKNGSVRVFFDDEAILESPRSPIFGLLSRWFGL